MPNYQQIIETYAEIHHFAGRKKALTEKLEQEEVGKKEKIRQSFIGALEVRQAECKLRYTIAMALLALALILLVLLAIFQADGLKIFKEVIGIVGGSSIASLLVYILSLRDEITKIKQMLIIAPALEMQALATLLLTLTAK